MAALDWSRVQDRARENEKKSSSALRREFLSWLCSQDELRPMRDHRQTSKMAFLETPSGDKLLWDLSANQKVCLWLSSSKAAASRSPAVPDMARPWAGDGRGRHSHLNTQQSFYGQDACRISCDTAGEAISALHKFGFISKRSAREE